MKISENFSSEEFISKSVHKHIINRGRNPKWYIREEIVLFCEWLKEECNGASITINTWKWGGNYNNSGLRTSIYIFGIDLFIQWARKWGKGLSQHRFMNAVDIKVKGYTPSQIEEIVESKWINIKTFRPTTMEKTEFTPSWSHFDWRWTDLDYLLKVGK